MNKIFLTCLLALLVIGVSAVAEKRKPTQPLGLIDQFNLRKSLAAVLDRASDNYETSFSKHVKDRAITNGREEMFSIYKNVLNARCGDKSSTKEKMRLVKAVWDILNEFLFRLDKVGLHHMCFDREVDYPTVVFDD